MMPTPYEHLFDSAISLTTEQLADFIDDLTEMHNKRYDSDPVETALFRHKRALREALYSDPEDPDSEFRSGADVCDAVFRILEDMNKTGEGSPQARAHTVVGSTFVQTGDLDTGESVEIRRLDGGALIGLDAAFLEQMGPDDEVYSPYDPSQVIHIPDDEDTE